MRKSTSTRICLSMGSAVALSLGLVCCQSADKRIGGPEQAAPPQPTALTGEADPIVCTPGGFRRASAVHRIAGKEVVRVAKNRTGRFDLLNNKFLDLPHVPPRHTSMTLSEEAAGTHGSGWIAYAYWLNNSGSAVGAFSTTWTVPRAPSAAKDQLIYLFEGIQSFGGTSAILQPVLQWGTSGAGGGAYWAVASWYVPSDGQAFCTEAVRVDEGAVLTGEIILTAKNGNACDYTCRFVGVEGTSLRAQGVSELVWCNETLEAYNITECGNYPGVPKTTMSIKSLAAGGTALQHVWTAAGDVTDCGQHVTVQANDSIDIFY